MFLLFLQICFSAGTTEEDEPSGITKFVIYAGRLIFNDDNDASCIACNGSCTEENAVKPHSWTASLQFDKAGETQYGDFELCYDYALKVAEYGVAGFTWTKDNHSCSLHVLDKEYDLSEAMVIYNGFDWIEENHYNTGPIYLGQYPSYKDEGSLDALCYYGILIQGSPNIASEVNTVLIGLVVIIMITWNGWMRYTNNIPSASPLARVTDEVSERSDHMDPKSKHNIYQPMSDPMTEQKQKVIIVA